MKTKINLIIIFLIIFFFSIISCIKKETIIINSTGKLSYQKYDTLIYCDTSLAMFDTLIISNKNDTLLFIDICISRTEILQWFEVRSVFAFELYTDSIIKGVIQTQLPYIFLSETGIFNNVYFTIQNGAFMFDHVYSFEYTNFIFYVNNKNGLVGYKNKKTNITMYLYKYLPYKN